jgi:hypothetical protein
MKEAPLMSLPRKKPGKLVAKAAKSLMKEVRLTSLLPRKPGKPVAKAVRLLMRKVRLTSLLPRKLGKPVAKAVRPPMVVKRKAVREDIIKLNGKNNAPLTTGFVRGAFLMPFVQSLGSYYGRFIKKSAASIPPLAGS